MEENIDADLNIAGDEQPSTIEENIDADLNMAGDDEISGNITEDIETIEGFKDYPNLTLKRLFLIFLLIILIINVL